MFNPERTDSLVKRNLVEPAILVNSEKRRGLPFKLSEKGTQIARMIISTIELEDRWRKWQEEFERTKDIKMILEKLNFL
jgi:Cys-tRNA synthase (O-phospho-L-seryl-tRNA:Cys-tRNA synthase)